MGKSQATSRLIVSTEKISKWTQRQKKERTGLLKLMKNVLDLLQWFSTKSAILRESRGGQSWHKGSKQGEVWKEGAGRHPQSWRSLCVCVCTCVCINVLEGDPGGAVSLPKRVNHLP